MNTKRILAVALSATMVFGSTLTAFADDPDTSAATGTGSGTGTSTSEGYVDTLVSGDEIFQKYQGKGGCCCQKNVEITSEELKCVIDAVIQALR